MPRAIPEERFDELVRVATEVFIAQGYRRTQMSDVAEGLGVAKGTLYLYVESKEALFDLCLRNAGRRGPVGRPRKLPVPTPKRGVLLRFLREALRRRASQTLVSEALRLRRAPDIRVELESVLRDLYDAMERSHVSLKLVDRAIDHPELGPEWQTVGREATRDRLTQYLEARLRSGQIRPLADPRIAARFVIETITTWAVHIKWDPVPQAFDEKVARDNAIEFLMRGLLTGDDA